MADTLVLECHEPISGNPACPAHTARQATAVVSFPARLPVGNPVEDSPGNWKSSEGTYS